MVQAYLHEHIPLSAAMKVEVTEATPSRVALRVPLAPNLNHQSTAFGGSVSALAILAGWTLVHLGLREGGVAAHTVVQRADIDYTAPVEGDFVALAVRPEGKAWSRFRRTLDRKSRARIRLAVEVREAGEVKARLEAAYVSFTG